MLVVTVVSKSELISGGSMIIQKQWEKNRSKNMNP
jgi:hypothetical protein